MTRRGPVRTLMLMFAAMTTFVGCGSGSSGFQPRAAELNAILASAQSGMCVAPGGLQVCARPARPGEGALCDAQGPGCRFVLTIDLHGLDPGSTVIAAVEPQNLSLPWRTSANALGPASDAGELSGDLSFVTDISPPTIAVRAILIYPAGVAPPNLGAEGIDVDLLAELNASRADALVDWPVETP